MSPHSILASFRTYEDPDIYADKSARVVEWILRIGIEKKSFSIRQVSRELDLSVGLVQKVFSVLEWRGFLKTMGSNTAKTFILEKPHELLRDWLENYSLVQKCTLWTYRTQFPNREILLQKLSRSGLKSKVMLALHSAAEAHHCKHTNLETLELYLLDPKIRKELESCLALTSEERGYDVLLIEPYYKNMLRVHHDSQKKILQSSPFLLTFLDLYHFPMRGFEQAEFMAGKIPELKRLYGK